MHTSKSILLCNLALCCESPITAHSFTFDLPILLLNTTFWCLRTQYSSSPQLTEGWGTFPLNNLPALNPTEPAEVIITVNIPAEAGVSPFCVCFYMPRSRYIQQQSEQNHSPINLKQKLMHFSNASVTMSTTNDFPLICFYSMYTPL